MSAYVLISTRCQHFRFNHVKTRRNRCSAPSCASPSFHHFCFLSSHLLPSLPYPTCINFQLHPSSSLILSAIVRVDVEHTVKVMSSYIIKGFCFLKVIQFLPEWSHRVQLFEEMSETIFPSPPKKCWQRSRSSTMCDLWPWLVTLTFAPSTSLYLLLARSVQCNLHELSARLNAEMQANRFIFCSGDLQSADSGKGLKGSQWY